MTPDQIQSFIVELQKMEPDPDSELIQISCERRDQIVRLLQQAHPPAVSDVPFAEIQMLYNHILGRQGLPACKLLTDRRRQQIRKRWEEDKSRQTPKWWADLFRRASRSNFLMGRKTNWRADFDFFLQPKSLTKLLEGSYDNHEAPSVFDNE